MCLPLAELSLKRKSFKFTFYMCLPLAGVIEIVLLQLGIH
jgi:hypothetical protein